MSDCLFCKIVVGEIPATAIYEDDLCIAFDDINPQSPVHVLVIPKKHIVSFSDASSGDAELLGHLCLVCARVAAEKGIGEDGYRVVVNKGEEAGQSVFHLHLHVLGGRRMSWPPG